jgi:hypothetical protein
LVGAQPSIDAGGVNALFYAAVALCHRVAPVTHVRASLVAAKHDRITSPIIEMSTHPAHVISREQAMTASHRLWRHVARAIAVAATLGVASAAELNPAAVTYKLPEQIPWGPVNAAGAQQAVVLGDPTKPGFYMVYNKWTKGNHFNRPHFHPNDRYIVVLQGTWWVGSGLKFDPVNGTVPMPAGTFVTHYAKQVHWDGAKDEDTILLITGEGPATSTLAEEK